MAAFVEKDDMMLISEPTEDNNTLDQMSLEEGTIGQRTSNTA